MGLQTKVILMKALCRLALFLVVFAVPGFALAFQPPAKDDTAKTKDDTTKAKDDAAKDKDDLPAKDTIAWNLKLIEDTPDLVVVKRTVSKDHKQVTWLVELKTDEIAGKLFFFGSASTFPQYFVRFFDEDNVMLKEVPITNGGGSYEKGQRVRVELKMPEKDIVQKAKSAKIVFRKN